MYHQNHSVALERVEVADMFLLPWEHRSKAFSIFIELKKDMIQFQGKHCG